MARPGKTTVDYFPHVTQTGKTMAILEARWGNDGYAFWFKTLELLGSSEGFAYNCNKSSNWEYLLSKTHVTQNVAENILDKLADIDAIDPELWKEKIIWSDHFTVSLRPVFDKRKSAPPAKPEIPGKETPAAAVSGATGGEKAAAAEFDRVETDKEEQSKVEDSKEKISKAEQSKVDQTVECTSRLRPETQRQADTVYLTAAEVTYLAKEYGEKGLGRIVAILDAYKTNHPEKCKVYRDDYKVILAWVVGLYLRENAKTPPLPRSGPKGLWELLPGENNFAADGKVRPFTGSLEDEVRKRVEAREKAEGAEPADAKGTDGHATAESRS